MADPVVGEGSAAERHAVVQLDRVANKWHRPQPQSHARHRARARGQGGQRRVGRGQCAVASLQPLVCCQLAEDLARLGCTWIVSKFQSKSYLGYI